MGAPHLTPDVGVLPSSDMPKEPEQKRPEDIKGPWHVLLELPYKDGRAAVMADMGFHT